MLAALISNILMGFALAADASSVSLVYGSRFKPFCWRHAAIPALAFGLAQGIMPAIGWFGGELIQRFVQTFGHWIAFGILLIIGIKFILDSRKDEEVETKDILKFGPILLTAFATSIDACAVGFSLALAEEPILLAAIIFAVVTFFCSILACWVGSKLGEKFGPKLLIIGGIILIGIGCRILINSLFPGVLPF